VASHRLRNSSKIRHIDSQPASKFLRFCLLRLQESGANLTFEARPRLCSSADMRTGRRFVYVLKNSDLPPAYYTGITSNLAERLADHNSDPGHHTSGRGPWRLDFVIKFADEERAIRFEKYLKSGSGCAFAKRHLR
jgi:putative endonuclease